ncbi:hypothetical protein EDD22DRAFT_614828 [Suillus occidentalis]|nr:hypothetical protein EDD22DRAFT_614828 [Suillus occidentalis]
MSLAPHSPSCPFFHAVLVALLASSDVICLFAGYLCSNPGMFLLHATLRQKLYRKRRRSPVNVSSLVLLCGQIIQKEVDSSFLIMARTFTCLPSETTTRIIRVFGYCHALHPLTPISHMTPLSITKCEWQDSVTLHQISCG